MAKIDFFEFFPCWFTFMVANGNVVIVATNFERAPDMKLSIGYLLLFVRLLTNLKIERFRVGLSTRIKAALSPL